VDEATVEVAFHEGRRHRVTVEEFGEEYRLTALVARRRDVAGLHNLPMQVWLRNRGTALVGFRIDWGGAVMGEAWVPKAGLTAEEFQVYVRAVATESDRFEYALTGKDVA
jgi:hypothetical protein